VRTSASSPGEHPDHEDGHRKKGLKDALQDVLAELAKCGVGTGCCIKEEGCDVSIPGGNEGEDGYEDKGGDLRKRFTEIEAQTVAAEACFDKLVDEPAQIPVRVQELMTRVAALATRGRRRCHQARPGSGIRPIPRGVARLGGHLAWLHRHERVL
jgi:hypothetical protein